MNTNQPSTWSVGQKIICINDVFPRAVLDWCDYLPRAGCVYTIRAMQLGRYGVTEYGCLGFLLEEIINPPSSLGREAGFAEIRFVPWLDAFSESAHNDAAEPVHLASTK
jgi:hypothetical protein